MQNINHSFLKTIRRIRESWPSLSQWRYLPRVLSKKELKLFVLFTILFIGSFLYLASSFYIKNTVPVPARGGTIIEGVVGHPRFLNPVYAETNDVDRDLVQLIFSGLLHQNREGELVPDIAKELTIGEGGKLFEIKIKEQIFWHDGVPLTADDILFTVKTIQNPAYKSPVRANWIGVTVQKTGEYSLQFRLQEPYAAFTERLTLKILPKHIWESIGPENFALSSYNLQAVGSGPFRIAKIVQDSTGAVSEIRLKPNLTYYKTSPYIQSIIFRFFASEQELAKAAKRGKVTSFSLNSPELIATAVQSNLTTHSLRLPRYFALFFNVKSGIGKDKGIRQALALSLDKEALRKEVVKEYGRTIDSPLLSDLFSLESPATVYELDNKEATSLLGKEGFVKENGRFVKVISEEKITAELKRGNQGQQVRLLQECLAKDPGVYSLGTVNGVFGPATTTAVNAFQEKYRDEILTPNRLSRATGTVGPSTRAKLNELCYSAPAESIPLTIAITTVEQLKPAAEALKKQWEAFGITVNIQSLSIAELERDAIKERNYETLLFGEVLGLIPDPYPFWHSSQKRDPGLNLSLYDSNSADKLLEQARKEVDAEKRITILQELQEILLQDLPAIFLYDMDYVYFTPKNVKGTIVDDGIISDPSRRFAEIEEWYIKTKRKWSF